MTRHKHDYAVMVWRQDGCSFREIATRLKISVSTAWRIGKDAWTPRSSAARRAAGTKE